MLKVAKIVTALVVTLLCVASMAMLLMRDASTRPEYCNGCHAVQPYYTTWATGDLLARSHALAAVPCQSCHPQDLQTTLQENVTNLQAGNTIQIASVAWTNAECLTCHGDQAALAEGTKNLDPNPHASPHTGGELDCNQCHKMHEPSEYPCIQCHTAVKTGPGWTTKVTQTLDVQVWSPDMDCALCHSMAPYAESTKDSTLLAYAHTQQGVKCQDCHDPQSLQQAHQQAVPGQPVQPIKVDMQTCLGCHVTNQHTSTQQVAQRTQALDPNPHAAPHVGVSLECSQCHKMHQPSQDLCAQCHPATTTPGWTKSTQTLNIKIWSPDTECTACHSMTPYADSLKNTNLLAYSHAQQGLKCQDCHTDAAALQQAHEKAVPGEAVKPLQVDNQVCLGCHVTNQHTSWEQIIARTKDYVVEGKNINPHAPHPAGADVPELQCSACHQMHEEQPLIKGCYGCHHQQDFRGCGDCHAEYLK